MGDSSNSKPGLRPGSPSAGPAKPAAGAKPNAPSADDTLAGRSGRVVHDERGNAVWSWVKEASRIAIDSTSRLLKRLEVPELKIEDTQDNPLTLESERDPGGGYDPYGSSSPGKGGVVGSRADSRGATPSRTAGGSSSGKRDVGGGYDPYGKGVTRKPPGRK
jgi:hypothetical protein